ncbi:MAG: ABC transporter permease [Longimicrobiales bacterium]
MEAILRELRFAFRSIGKTPGTSVIAVIALALGIGLTVIMFSIVYGAMLRGLPFDESQDLIAIDAANPSRGMNRMAATIQDFSEWRARQRSFTDLGGYTGQSLNLAFDGASPERLQAARMDPAMFKVLRAQPVHGRVFTDEENRPGAPLVVVIGYHLWQQTFNGSPGVLGRAVRLNGEAATIIGVMPERFGFPNRHNAWVPLRIDPVQSTRATAPRLQVLGRLRDGVSLDQALSDLNRIATDIAARFPDTNKGVGVIGMELRKRMFNGEERATLWMMFGAVTLVLLIACANVANLLIGRALIRTKEVAVRTALGASRWRVMSQFLIEAFSLALLGATFGTAIGFTGISLFNRAIVDTDPPYWLLIQLDGAALLCIGAAMLLATLAAGAVPAWQAARANTQGVLKDESRGTSSFRLSRLTRGLVAVEIALSAGLLFWAGLMIKTVVKVNTIDLGFETTRIFTARLTDNPSQYTLQHPGVVPPPEQRAAERQRRIRFADELLAGLRLLPPVEHVALSNGMPGRGSNRRSYRLEGTTETDDNRLPVASDVVVTPDFFHVLGVSPVNGRLLTATDVEGSLPVAVVNRSFVERHFQNSTALGRRIRMAGDSTAPWVTIVGVVPDLYASGLENEEPAAFYRPFAQEPFRTAEILARTRGNPTAIAHAVRQTVARIDRDVPLEEINSLAGIIDDENWYYAVFGSLFIAFGAAALFLGSVGLYGVVAFSVGQRRREMGVRMAMGATAIDVLKLVFRGGMKQVAIGLGLGTALALPVAKLMAALLFQVKPIDLPIYSVVVLVLVGTAALACYVPARRAARVDPIEALRAE